MLSLAWRNEGGDIVSSVREIIASSRSYNVCHCLSELKAVEPSHFVLAGLDRIASAFASFTVGKPPSSYALMP